MRWPWRRRERISIASGMIPKLEPGQGIEVHSEIPAGVDPSQAMVRLDWTCGGCWSALSRELTVLDANGSEVQIACPICDPDVPASRDVKIERAGNGR